MMFHMCLHMNERLYHVCVCAVVRFRVKGSYLAIARLLREIR